ncbi:MAG TPA: cytochrome c3 family protein [Opitutus sp.]|nr:cytochrome c3 family protein [Opitutus sp.]
MKTSTHSLRGRTCSRLVRAPLVVLGLVALAALPARASSVIDSVHNLAAGGPGAIKSTTETNPCSFCHTVHKVNGVSPLWNHTLSAVDSYVVYSSARLDSLGITVPQPNGGSKLCLSCHDGTVALGSISSSATTVTVYHNGSPITTMPAGPSNLGTDLSGDHPISVDYDAAALADTTLQPRNSINSAVYLEPMNGGHYVQCASCHNPHDNQYGNFLVMDNSSSQLCEACHQPGQWTTSPHATSSTPAPAAVVDALAKSGRTGRSARSVGRSVPMSELGCANCHMNHNAAGKQHLLLAQATEQNCLDCHNGVTVKKSVAADIQKPSIHPVTLHSQAHSSTEDPVNPRTRHVVCADCHDPHSASTVAAVAPNAPGALANLTGVTETGGIVKPLQREYELCFRCHADSIDRGPATVTRQFPETNTRLQFAATNQSFHPVVTVGKNTTSVPSLIAPWTTNSVMYCTDCHNSDSGPHAGGAGANGPHGSIYAPILERNLVTQDNQPESPAAYALCYKCHDRGRVLSNLSFRYHESHVVQDKAACSTCHDSHGVANAPHLVNFNTLYVTPGSNGILSYASTGLSSGNCTLTCHGHDHKNTAY